MSEKEKMVKEETSKEVKPQVTEKEIIYGGIELVKDINFIPRSKLTREDVKKFEVVQVEISSVFREGKNPRIGFKVFPFVAKPHVKVKVGDRETYERSNLIRLNEDISNNIRLSANEYTAILLANKLPLEMKDKNFSMLRYARFISGISQKDGKRYNKVQVFLSMENVKTLWLSEFEMNTVAALIKSKLIDPVVFYEATSEELELDSASSVEMDLI